MFLSRRRNEWRRNRNCCFRHCLCVSYRRGDCSLRPKHTDLYKCPAIMIACHYSKHSWWTHCSANTHTHRSTTAASTAHQHRFSLKSYRSSMDLWPLTIHNIYLVANRGYHIVGVVWWQIQCAQEASLFTSLLHIYSAGHCRGAVYEMSSSFVHSCSISIHLPV